MKKGKEYTVLDYDIDDYLEGVVITFKVIRFQIWNSWRLWFLGRRRRK